MGKLRKYEYVLKMCMYFYLNAWCLISNEMILVNPVEIVISSYQLASHKNFIFEPIDN